MKAPYQQHWEREIDKQQFGYLDVAVGANGQGTLNAKFSNGKKVDGDHFFVSVAFVDAAGISVASHRLVRGLKASYFGKAVEGFVQSPIQFKHGKSWSDVDDVRVQFGMRPDVDDEKFWKDVIEVVAKIIEVIVAKESASG